MTGVFIKTLWLNSHPQHIDVCHKLCGEFYNTSEPLDAIVNSDCAMSYSSHTFMFLNVYDRTTNALRNSVRLRL